MKAALTIILLLVATSGFAAKRVIHTEKSLYRNISVEKNGSVYCLIFETRKINPPYQTCLDKARPNSLIFNYSKLVMSGRLYKPNPSNILVLGLGGGTLPMTLSSMLPEATITSVEIDPAVIKIAKDYFDYLESDKIKTVERDARIFVKRQAIKKATYDWIILDAFNGDYIPEHLMTREFLEEVKSILSDDGIITANTFSDSLLYQYESATYHAVFGDYYNVSRQRGNRIILTGKQGPLLPIEQLKSQAVKQKPTLKPYNVDTDWLMQRIQLASPPAKDTPVLTDQYSPANLLKSQ